MKKNIRWNINKVRQYVEENTDTILLSTEYTRATDKLDFQCACGREFSRSWGNFYHNNQRTCSTCSTPNNSKGEARIKDLLDRGNYKYDREWRTDECRDIYPLPFDFAVYKENGDIDFLIEFDGPQHYIPFAKPRGGKSSEERLISQQKRDKIKNDYCAKVGIPLLRIPYDKYNFIEYLFGEFVRR